MKQIAIIFVVAVLSPTFAQAQQLTREETFEYLTRELSEIQGDAQELRELETASQLAVPRVQGRLQSRIRDLLERASSVRDHLADNPYVRVSGFSVTIPWGVTFQFIFPTPADTEQAEQ